MHLSTFRAALRAAVRSVLVLVSILAVGCAAGRRSVPPDGIYRVCSPPGADCALASEGDDSTRYRLDSHGSVPLDLAAAPERRTDARGASRIGLTLAPAAAARFAALTRDHIGSRMAVVVDGKVAMAPAVRTAIEGSSLEISGCGTCDELLQHLAASRTRH